MRVTLALFLHEGNTWVKVVINLVIIVPSNIVQLRRVLGLLRHYRHYIKGFSRIAQPLFDQLKNDNIILKVIERF